MLCNTAFSTRGGLTRHTMKEHKGHKIFMCDTCGKKFQTYKTLDVHKKVVHQQVIFISAIKLALFFLHCFNSRLAIHGLTKLIKPVTELYNINEGLGLIKLADT